MTNLRTDEIVFFLHLMKIGTDENKAIYSRNKLKNKIFFRPTYPNFFYQEGRKQDYILFWPHIEWYIKGTVKMKYSLIYNCKALKFWKWQINLLWLVRAPPSKMREPYSNQSVCLSVHTLL